MKDDSRYAALISLWQHHNSSQFQWPPIILGAIFVAVSLLVSGVEADRFSTTNWDVDAKVKYGTALPMILIGLGTMAMLYTMARERKVRGKIEEALKDLDPEFYGLNHPNGPSGAKLVWRFIAVVAFAMLVFGDLLLCGVNYFLLALLGSVTLAPWVTLCLYGWSDTQCCRTRNESANNCVNRSVDPPETEASA